MKGSCTVAAPSFPLWGHVSSLSTEGSAEGSKGAFYTFAHLGEGGGGVGSQTV